MASSNHDSCIYNACLAAYRGNISEDIRAWASDALPQLGRELLCKVLILSSILVSCQNHDFLTQLKGDVMCVIGLELA